MKKLLLSITAVLAVTFTNAQGIYIASDSAALSAWTPYDADGDGNDWTVQNLTGGTQALSPQGWMLMSESYINGVGALTPNNLIVSPAINCSSNASVFLTWGAGSNETTASTYHEEYYSVYVVNNPATLLGGVYPAAVYEGVLPAGAMMDWKSMDVSTLAANQSTVYIVFRHHNCTDEFQLYVDGIQLTPGVLGLEEATVKATAYPNPANSTLNVATTGSANSISIISMDGKVVATANMSGLEGSIDVSNLTEGVYFYEVAADNGAVIRNTFVKK